MTTLDNWHNHITKVKQAASIVKSTTNTDWTIEELIELPIEEFRTPTTKSVNEIVLLMKECLGL